MCTCTVRSLVSQRAHGEITLSIVSIIRLHVMNNDKQMETGRKKEASRTEIFTSNLMDLIKVPALTSWQYLLPWLPKDLHEFIHGLYRLAEKFTISRMDLMVVQLLKLCWNPISTYLLKILGLAHFLSHHKRTAPESAWKPIQTLRLFGPHQSSINSFYTSPNGVHFKKTKEIGCESTLRY